MSENRIHFNSFEGEKSTSPKKVGPCFAGTKGHLISVGVTSRGAYSVLSSEQNISLVFLNPVPSIRIGPPEPSAGPLLGTNLLIL